MTIQKGIGFLGGGQMAEAIIKGLLSKNFLPKNSVMASDPSKVRRDYLENIYGVRVADSNKDVVDASDVLVLAVKPQVVLSVLDDVREHITDGHLMISIAAGIPLATLEMGLPPASRVVRVMPNTPALVGQGAAAICSGGFVLDGDISLAREILGAVGTTVVLHESLMDAVTGLSGSGPAYVFTFIEGLIEAGVREGLARPIAAELVLQTVLGSVIMCKETGKSPPELTSMVTSPGGTTIEGLHVLEKGAFRGVLMDAVRAAAARSRELGRKA